MAKNMAAVKIALGSQGVVIREIKENNQAMQLFLRISNISWILLSVTKKNLQYHWILFPRAELADLSFGVSSTFFGLCDLLLRLIHFAWYVAATEESKPKGRHPRKH
jgi:hypothetical protein